ncbi:disulfide oxidoreductase [Alkalihalobacillus sp. FSL R5-0424]
MSSSSVNNILLYLAWLVAVIATLGSLYFSEIKGFIPCGMCWYQRIAMYPLAVFLGIAAFYNDYRVRKYVLPITMIGSLISLYHYSMQKMPTLFTAQPCSSGVPCNMQYINWFDFITIPLLAFTAFILITFALVFIRIREN